MEIRNNRKKPQAPVAEEVYIPPQATEEEFQNFDDNMFRLQSELRNLVSDELELYDNTED